MRGSIRLTVQTSKMPSNLLYLPKQSQKNSK
jgi:hypothetical protein